ncbi:polysaccharide deacetylase family protein [Nocardioides sp. LHD-245]|uniref:polysaccharide deacetylase family protein n=1 Tax=Nocardioides sp. LHD-245 TaxID=3051387 RepID=UPI0027DF0846|nr:polysaccharide deacetylase family protein [Nocardioides sp. LHD-245]
MSRRAPLVLMYHGVDRVPAERDPHAMFVTPASFRAQIEHLLEEGFVPLSEQAFVEGRRSGTLPSRSVLITFDDGYVGVGEHALPVLESFGVPSVLYVPAALVGGRSDWLEPRHRHPLMTGEELRTADRRGMAIGAHGTDHQDLTRVSGAELRRQTTGARRALGELLGRPVTSFAFPFGSHDARVRAAVRAAGYETAFAVHEAAGGFAVGRVDVNAVDTMRTFRVKLHRLYPHARRVSGRVPAVRRVVHDLLGRAPRDRSVELPDRAGAR